MHGSTLSARHVDPCVAALRRATYQLLATTRAGPHWLLFDSKSVVH